MSVNDDINQMIGQVAYGSINFEIKRYDNNTVGLVGGLTHSFKPDDNIKAVEYILGEIKQAIRDKYKGTQTISIVHTGSGDIKRIIKQDYDSKTYDLGKQ